MTVFNPTTPPLWIPASAGMTDVGVYHLQVEAVLALLAIVITIALFANQIAPYDALHTEFTMLKAAPTASHLMGTDLVGRDVLSRIIVGTRVSLLVAFVSVAMGVGVGFFWGVSTGYIGGKFDLLGQRILDVLLSFPSIILALLLMVPLGRGFGTVVLAIAVITVPGAARLVRSTALSVTETAYVGRRAGDRRFLYAYH